MKNKKLTMANERYNEALQDYMSNGATAEAARELTAASKALNDAIDKIEAGEEEQIAKTMSNGELFRFAWAAVREAIENAKRWETPDEREIAKLKRQERELEELMEKAFT